MKRMDCTKEIWFIASLSREQLLAGMDIVTRMEATFSRLGARARKCSQLLESCKALEARCDRVEAALARLETPIAQAQEPTPHQHSAG
jgi:BMFP domain-containing protein YqiC